MKMTCIVSTKNQKSEIRHTICKNNHYILRISLVSVPEKNKANDELINLLSYVFEIKKNSISICLGKKFKNKLVTISGISEEEKKNIESKLIFLSK